MGCFRAGPRLFKFRIVYTIQNNTVLEERCIEAEAGALQLHLRGANVYRH